MDQQIKAAWVAKLRSGTIKQVHGVLRNDEGMCCLGVLCELHREEKLYIDWSKDRENYRYLGFMDILPPEVAIWAKLTDNVRPDNPHVNGFPLAQYNDGTADQENPSTFAEIADLIEASL